MCQICKIPTGLKCCFLYYNKMTLCHWNDFTFFLYFFQVTHWHSPYFYAYFPCANSFPALLADMLSGGIGCIGFSWVFIFSTPSFLHPRFCFFVFFLGIGWRNVNVQKLYWLFFSLFYSPSIFCLSIHPSMLLLSLFFNLHLSFLC